CLDKGGRFIINSAMIAESILPNFSMNKTFTVGDITMDINNIYNTDESYMISNIHYKKGDKKEQHAFKHYVFTLAEVKRLLQSCQLQIVATYSSPSKEPYQLGDPQI